MRPSLFRISTLARHSNLLKQQNRNSIFRSTPCLASLSGNTFSVMTTPLEKTTINIVGTTEEKLIFAPPIAQYKKDVLDRHHLDADPVDQFHKWFKEAQKHVDQPEALTLSTAHLPSGRVSSRVVYMKELTHLGFVIYSNFGTSLKAGDLRSNPNASILFGWKEFERQVRVEGVCERISAEESQKYYDTRARGSQIGAWASRQSEIIENREVLEKWVKEQEERWEGKEKIVVPDFWGGLRLRPLRIEFWQGRDSRLHDRFEYVRDTVDGEWRINRLSP